jgi:hypothetical protein
MAAVLLIENALAAAGTLYVIPGRTIGLYPQRSPGRLSPGFYHRDSRRKPVFPLWVKSDKPIHQWPDPDVYIHASSGQSLSGNETRNLNEAIPASPMERSRKKSVMGSPS